MQRTYGSEVQGGSRLGAPRRRLRLGFAALLTSAIAALLSASPAIAGTVGDQRPLLFSFDGGDSSVGPFTAPLAVASDELSGDVYAINAAGSGQGPGPFDHERVVCKFNAEGKALVFSASGKSCLDGSETPAGAFGVEGFFGVGAYFSDIAIDNSGGAGKAGEGEQGRIYVSEESGPVHAYAPDGTWIRTLTFPPATASACGITVDRKGNLLVGTNHDSVVVFDAGGNQIEEIPITHGNKRACRLAMDHDGKGLYVGLAQSGIDKYVEGVYDSTLVPAGEAPVFEVTIDPSKQTGHIFTMTTSNFAEYQPCEALGCPGTEVEGSPFGGDLLGTARGIAYNREKDWVYVSDQASGTVKVFGPVASGTVPDVNCQTTEPVGLHSATAHCTINPLGLPNDYHFEWKEGTGASWGAANSSPSQSIEPTDGNPHLVSLEITGLKSNRTHQVRLAGANAETGLNAYSSADTFSTKTPPPPIVSCEISAATTQSAHLACSIDSREEETTWRVEKSIDPACKKDFSSEPEQTIPEGEPAPVDVERDLKGLLPAQHYCVRLTAAGPAEPGSSLVEFSTKAIPPSEASIAFAAPRTDTTARINARANPNGEAAVTGGLSYQFELSEDDGVSWTLLGLRKSMVDAREPIVLAENLEGLEPDTTYLYRLKLVENKVGPVAPPSEARAFTTRTSAEMALPAPNAFGEPRRGIELVNQPEKGTQNAIAFGPVVGSSPMSADGDEVFWSVTAGAPGAPNGTLNTFLAKRTEGGWRSQGIAPLPGGQLEGGELAYELSAASADLGTYIFNARRSTGLSAPEPPTFVRVKPGQEEEVLKSYELQPPNSSYASLLDLTDDAEHVLFPDNKTFQIEDIGREEDPEVVSLMPDGSLSCGLNLETSQGFARNFIWHPGYHWIATTDASRVYFQVRAKGECGKKAGEPAGLPELYVRNREAGKTTLIDPGTGGKAPEFIRATPDGRQAYFLTYGSCRRYTQENLPTCDLPETADVNEDADVYRWEESEGESVCLTCAVSDASIGPRVLVSNDFSHLYFESEKQLVPGQGKAGDLNVYVLHGGEIDFVADTAGASALDRNGDPALTSDGNVLLFEAPASPALTADAVGPLCIAPISQQAGKCEELYRYDDRDGSLECISCRQGGITTHSAGAPAGTSGIHFKLSGDGTTVAFVTQQALLPLDVNQDTDIYEWRNGALRLITNGVSDFQTNFTAPQVLAVDRDGRSILFGLVPPGGSLTGFERDQLLNVYEARIGGGFPPPQREAHCIEDSCQGPLQDAPSLEQSASASFHGKGNLTKHSSKPRCAKGKVRRSGHCVKKHAAKHRKHRRTPHGRANTASKRRVR